MLVMGVVADVVDVGIFSDEDGERAGIDECKKRQATQFNIHACLLAAVCVYAGCVTLTSKTGSCERMQYATPRSDGDYGASERW